MVSLENLMKHIPTKHHIPPSVSVSKAKLGVWKECVWENMF